MAASRFAVFLRRRLPECEPVIRKAPRPSSPDCSDSSVSEPPSAMIFAERLVTFGFSTTAVVSGAEETPPSMLAAVRLKLARAAFGACAGANSGAGESGDDGGDSGASAMLGRRWR